MKGEFRTTQRDSSSLVLETATMSVILKSSCLSVKFSLAAMTLIDLGLRSPICFSSRSLTHYASLE